MQKMLTVTLSLIVYLFCAKAHAFKTITLSPNENKEFTNTTLWKLNATCNVHGAHQNGGKIKIRVLKNKGAINGKNLSKGQATFVNVKHNSNIAVTAEAGTQINLTNLSSEQLEAVCHI